VVSGLAVCANVKAVLMMISDRVYNIFMIGGFISFYITKVIFAEMSDAASFGLSDFTDFRTIL